jgi:hypothetical protein
MVNKRIVMMGAVVGMTLGAVVPMLWGDYDSFGMMSLLLAMVGGFVGIWLAVWLGKRFS